MNPARFGFISERFFYQINCSFETFLQEHAYEEENR